MFSFHLILTFRKLSLNVNLKRGRGLRKRPQPKAGRRGSVGRPSPWSHTQVNPFTIPKTAIQLFFTWKGLSAEVFTKSRSKTLIGKRHSYFHNLLFFSCLFLFGFTELLKCHRSMALPIWWTQSNTPAMVSGWMTMMVWWEEVSGVCPIASHCVLLGIRLVPRPPGDPGQPNSRAYPDPHPKISKQIQVTNPNGW